MPSTQLTGAQSGGSALVSGNIFSGYIVPLGGIQLFLDTSGAGPVFIGLPPPSFLSGQVSGYPQVTILSGGTFSSGGLGDGMKLDPSRDYFVPKSRLTSGIQSIRIGVPATSSGAVLFWEMM